MAAAEAVTSGPTGTAAGVEGEVCEGWDVLLGPPSDGGGGLASANGS